MSGSLFIISGVAAFLQVCFLPGFIATRLLKFSDTIVERLVIGFGISLMVNYWIIFILAALHIYTVWSLIVLLVIEVAVIFATRNKKVDRQKLDLSWLRTELFIKEKNWLKILIAAVTSLTFLYLLYLFIDNIGTIFKLSDAVNSWNRWAVEWSTNMLPSQTWEYPQLVPANWSVFYVYFGQSIEYFAKMIMPLFPIGIALTLFFTGLKKKSWAYIAAVPAVILIMRLMVGSELMATEGYVDTAVAFFATISLLAPLWGPNKKNLLIGALFAIGTLMTKQAGLLLIIIYPLFAWFYIFKENPEFRAKIWKYIGIYIALIIILAGPFFIYKKISIATHQDISVVPTITELIYGGGKNPIAVAAHALYFLIGKTHGLILIYLAFLFVALRERKYRAYALIALVFTIIWSFFNSYDTRNLTLSLPFWALATGFGLEYLFLREGHGVRLKFTKSMLAGLCIIIFIGLVVASPWVKRKVVENYTADKRVMYDTELSILLNNYFDSAPKDGKILTNLNAFYFFPEYKDRIYSIYNGYPNTKSDFDHYEIDSINPKVSYILAAPYSDKKVFEDIESKIKSDRFTLIFRNNGYILVKTNNI